MNHHEKLNYTKFAIAVVLPLFAACNFSQAQNPPPANTLPAKPGLPLASQWVIEKFDARAFTPTTKSSYVTISADLKSYSGKGGCNAMQGMLTIDKNAIKFGPAAMTKMACPHLAQENLFMQNLRQANTYKIIDGQLFLYDGSTLMMTLESYKG